MSHMVSVSVGDCKQLEDLKSWLDENKTADDETIHLWIATLDSILAQAYEDGR